MTKARNIANLASDGSALSDGTINYTDITGTPAPFDPDTLATVATTGAYGDLSGTPAAALPLAGGTLTGDVNLGDSVKANFGAGSDLQIYHNSANNKSYIEESGSGNLVIRGSDIDILAGNGEAAINVAQDGAVTLYHDNAIKLATTATGISVTGNATFADNDKAIFGAGSDLQIYHDGNSKITDVGDGKLELHSNGTGVTIQKGATEYMAQFNVDGAVQLYYDNAEKLATTATGVTVTGTVAATSYTGDGSGLTGVSPPTTFGAVGTYTWGRTQDDTSNLLPSNTTASLYAAGQRATYPVVFFRSGTWDNGATTGAVSGTWRCMSPAYADAGRGYLGLFVRIA
jgi:hypothetical protein